MAKGFGQVIAELAEQDPRICGVSCDCWGFLAPLAARFPDRAIEIGIAEQNLISIAAGLAMRGKIPFALGMNPFVTMRCFEQIRTDLGYGRRNVKVIGAYGSGLMYAGWGCTQRRSVGEWPQARNGPSGAGSGASSRPRRLPGRWS